MSAYLEEQIHGLALMCEALICWIHWDQTKKGSPNPGHNAYPASGCKHETCTRYAEGHSLQVFGRHQRMVYELRDEIEVLKTKLAQYEPEEEPAEEPV